jgi:hypothetical protein
MRKLILLISIFLLSANLSAASYTAEQCQGSLGPYPVPAKSYNYPDSLKPIFISHVGRHGSRYPASAASALYIIKALNRADSLGTLTKLGREFKAVVDNVIKKSSGQWGMLDSLGKAEQTGIAARMLAAYPQLFDNGNVSAVASSSMRVIESMDAFTAELSKHASNLRISKKSDEKYNKLVRPFDVDSSYIEFAKNKTWEPVYDRYFDSICPLAPIRRILGDKYPASDAQMKQYAISEYYIIAGLKAMGITVNYNRFFTLAEYNKLWSTFNLRQYLQRTASTVSIIPANIAIPLIQDIVNTADKALSGTSKQTAALRFTHGETIMPLLSLLHLKGCFYLTLYFDTVLDNWHDFYVTPMASNLQMIFFKSNSGKIYVRTDLNERPIPLIQGHNEIYVPWDKARTYLLNFTNNIL